MANIDELIPLVLSDVPEAPKMKVRAALIRKARELCRRARIWTYTGRSTLPEGSSKAYVDLPKDTALLSLEEIKGERQSYGILTGTPLDIEGAARAASVENDGDYFLQFDGLAKEKDRLTIKVTCLPTFDAASLPDVVTDQWAEGIAAGAAAYLLMQPKAAWGIPELAPNFNAQFEQAVHKAKIQKAVGMSGSSPTVKPRRWV